LQWSELREQAGDARAHPVQGGVFLTVVGTLAHERLGQWRRGRTIRASTLLRRPSRYLNPGVPDQERAFARRGTTLVGSVKSAGLVEVIARGSLLAETAASVRAYARRAIARSVGLWSERSAAIVTAIVLGDRSGLAADVERQLQEAGTYHVIAISGGNIAILAGATLTAFRIAGLLGRGAMLVAISGLAAYGYVVAGGASVDRATLMAIVYFAGRAIDLRGPPLNSLALVAGLLVLSDPLAVADPAFLLTFGATAAILIAVPGLGTPALRGWRRPIATMFVASAAAEVALFPVAAAIFSRVTVAGLLLNFAAIPLMAVAQVVGMLVVALFAIAPAAAAALGWVAHIGADGLVRTAGLVQWAPSVAWRVAPPGALPIVLYYASVIVAWTMWRYRVGTLGSAESAVLRATRRGSLFMAMAAAMWMLAEPWTLIAARGDGRLHVKFLDVGQGDAAFVKFPRGDTFLVDTGGLGGRTSFDIGDRVVAPVLRTAGVRRLGTLVLTHGDADHIGGAAAIIREFKPRDVWEGVPVPQFEPLHALRADVRNRGLRWATVQTNDAVAANGVLLTVRHPDLSDWERQNVRNDDSIVLELRWGEVSIILTGDIGRDVEGAIASQLEPAALRVVKVPHHGSLTSSSPAFVRALAPRAAIVSVGRNNNFGHPAPAVLQRYAAAGAEIFRTDRDGAVTVDTDGKSLNVRTFTRRHAHIVSQRTVHKGTASTEAPPQ
jgi:competence protein ComEC